MNERIRQLAEQANGPNPFYGTLKNQMTLLGDDAVEKFAELIVQECMEQVWYTRENVIDSNISEVIKERIKEHFGVEDV